MLDKILVGVDFSENSLRALSFAIDIAEKFNSTITVLNVVYPPTLEAPAEHEVPFPWLESFSSDWKKYNEQALAKVVSRSKERKPNLAISSLIREGQPAPQIVDAAKDFDVIVIGQKGRAMPEALMGSISEKVVMLARCPVIIVP